VRSQRGSLGFLGWEKGIARSDAPIETVVLKILGEEMLKAIVLSVRPKMSIEPSEPVRSGTAESEPQDAVVRIKHSELAKELLRFAASFVWLQKCSAANERACNDSDELDDGLMRNANGIVHNPLAQYPCRDALLFRESRVVPVDQDVSINQRRHGCIGPLVSTLDLSAQSF